MSILPWFGIASLTLAFFAATARIVRSGDTRWWPLAALLALLSALIAIAFVLDPAALPAFPLETVQGLVIAATGALGVLVALTYARTTAERDRAETLHWESMEMIRAIGDLHSGLREDIGVEERLERMLEIGRKRFGAAVGLVTRIRGDRWEVIAARAPHALDLSRGTVLRLADTFCERVLATGHTLAFSKAEAALWSDHPAKLALGFGSYLGAVVRVGGKPFGTLCFASLEAAPVPFTATQRDLASLLAQWVGFEIERALAKKVARGAGAKERPRSRAGHATPAGFDSAVETATPSACVREPELTASQREIVTAEPRSGLDVNATLEGMKDLLERRVGNDVTLTLTLAADLRPALAPGSVFRQLVLGIVGHAAASTPAAGELELETGLIERAECSKDTGSVGKASPCGFVTLAVRDGAADADPAEIGTRFEAALRGKPEDAPARSRRSALALPEIERIVRGLGGDLSLSVEAGLGSTYTVFLPEAGNEIGTGVESRRPRATSASGAASASRADARTPGAKNQLSFLT